MNNLQSQPNQDQPKQKLNKVVVLLAGIPRLAGAKPMVHVIIIVAALVVGIGSVVFMKKGPTQECIEETAEQVIKQETGVDVDFEKLRDN